jgi:hypothetical protein
MERDEEHFDLDEEFVAGAEDEDYDRFIDRGDRRKATATKRGRAARRPSWRAEGRARDGGSRCEGRR